MVTGFVIEKGYSVKGIISNEQLIELVKSIRLEAILAKAWDFANLYMSWDNDYAWELIQDFKDLPTKDLTCYFIYKDDDETKDVQVNMSCSGYGDHRIYREVICRAFGFLVLEEAFKKGYAMNFGSY